MINAPFRTTQAEKLVEEVTELAEQRNLNVLCLASFFIFLSLTLLFCAFSSWRFGSPATFVFTGHDGLSLVGMEYRSGTTFSQHWEQSVPITPFPSKRTIISALLTREAIEAILC
jgi:hypothetical protein